VEVERYAILVIATVSFSMLTYQILLTRISALRLFFHFSFLVISNCLLGIGAAGTLITLFQKEWRPKARQQIWLFCVLYIVSLCVAYVFLLTFPIPSTLNLLQPLEFLRFSVFNLVAAVPFFFAGAVVGMILTFNAAGVNRLYFSDLIGAGVGCLVCPLALWAFGAGGAFLTATLAAILAAVLAAPQLQRRTSASVGILLGALAIALLPRLDAWFPVPAKGDLQFTETYTANMSEVTAFSRWSATSRIDLVPVAEDRRYMFARGLNGLEVPLPEEKFVLQDGSAGTFILNFSEHPEALRAIELSLYSAAMVLKEQPRVFIIGVGGGNDVWAAKHANARSVKGVELNAPILDIHRDVLPHYSRTLLEDARIEFVSGEGRSALMREEESYDVIQMSGIDTWTALASGAHVLAENYLYTSEAIQSAYAHLQPGGVLHIMRFAATMESLRLLANLNHALRALGAEDLRRSVICLSTQDQLFSVLLKKGTYTPEELDRIDAFAAEAGIRRVYLPGRTPPSPRNPVFGFLASDDRDAFIRHFPRDISPTTDDRPYFFNYSKWSRPLDSVKWAWSPTSVSQGNPFLLLAQLLLSTVLALTLIVIPLLASPQRSFDRLYAPRFFGYFLGLGAGFIAIEIALMQKLTLFLGHPLYSITVTLFCILVFTGIGSLLSAHWFETSGSRAWLVPAGIALFVGLFIIIAPGLTRAYIGQPLPVRILMTAGLLAPIAFLLGVPLAYGIRLLHRINPSLIPWAWAVNACFTVVGSILAAILSMNLGFNAVLIAAVIVYAAAFAALPRRAAA
jgi:spermidine synthase